MQSQIGRLIEPAVPADALGVRTVEVHYCDPLVCAVVDGRVVCAPRGRKARNPVATSGLPTPRVTCAACVERLAPGR